MPVPKPTEDAEESARLDSRLLRMNQLRYEIQYSPPPNRRFPKEKFITFLEGNPQGKPQNLCTLEPTMAEGESPNSENGKEEIFQFDEAKAMYLLEREKSEYVGSLEVRLPHLPQEANPEFAPQYTVSHCSNHFPVPGRDSQLLKFVKQF